MDKLKAMQAAIAIADAGSLTAAAATLHTSLPAVVRTLAQLEQHLGVRLFNRTTRRVALTDEGRRYVEDCRRLLATIADTEASLLQDTVEPAGHLTVSAPVLFGQMHVAPAVVRFVQRHPKMRVSLQAHDRIVNLMDENIDVGVRIGTLEDQSLVAQTLGTVRRVVAATPRYLKKHGTPQHPRDLLDHNCLRVTGSSVPGWMFSKGGKAYAVPVTGNLDFNHVWPAAQACLAHMGVGMFVSYQIAEFVAAGRLRIVLDDHELAPRPVSLVYPHARLLPARTRVFIEWMKRELSFGAS